MVFVLVAVVVVERRGVEADGFIGGFWFCEVEEGIKGVGE